MAGNSLLTHILLILGLTTTLGAQDHRFMVFFSDKGTEFSTDEPLEFLSIRAVERRNKQQILIAEEDLPVNKSYMDGLSNQGVIVSYPTKWLNGALIQADSSQLGDITSLSYVTSIEHVAPGPLTPQNGMVKPNKNKNKNRNARINLASDLQNQLLGIDQMHQAGIRGQGMLVAVLDDGFQGVNSVEAFSHVFTNNQLLATYDFLGDSEDVFRYDDHGTRVFSVIAAEVPGLFTGGVPDAEFILCVTEDVSSEYRIEEYNWVFAAELADSAGADIINTSLGYNVFDDPDMNYTVDQLDGESTVISRAASIAASKGMVLTVSAGNSGNSLWQTITAPADALDVLAVGAINSDTLKAGFSSIGPTTDGRIKPDVVSIGVSTSLINAQGNEVFNNGTSFSAPQLASLATGIWQSNPQLNYKEVLAALRNSGSMVQNPDNQLGYGIPNFTRVDDIILSVDENTLRDLVNFYPNPIDHNLFFVSEKPMFQVRLNIHNLHGQRVLESFFSQIPANQEISVDLPALDRGVYLVNFLSTENQGSFRLIKH